MCHWHILAPRRGCFSNHLPLRRMRIFASSACFNGIGNSIGISYSIKKGQGFMLKLCPFTQSFLQIFFQILDLVCLLPGQIQVGAAKVAVSCRLLVDRSAQIQHADNSSRAQIEVLADNLYQLGIRYLASSEGVHIDRSRARYADGIGQLNLTTGQPDLPLRCSLPRNGLHKPQNGLPWCSPCRRKLRRRDAPFHRRCLR